MEGVTEVRDASGAQAASSEAVIAIEGLGLAYERDGHRTAVLEGLDLTIRRGELVAVVGESGVGKSTLLRVLIGLAKPSAGHVRVNARSGHAPMALVFQDARLLPWRRVLSNVAFGLEWRGIPRAERIERARRMLRLVGLGDFAHRWPHQLSGGQRQRVSLARALAVDPDVLLMDEPFSALDSFTRESLQDELQRIRAETGKTVLFVTHDMDEAVYLADRVIVLAGAPAGITAMIDVAVSYPRRRDDPALAATVRQLRAELSARSAEL